MVNFKTLTQVIENYGQKVTKKNVKLYFNKPLHN